MHQLPDPFGPINVLQLVYAQVPRVNSAVRASRTRSAVTLETSTCPRWAAARKRWAVIYPSQTGLTSVDGHAPRKGSGNRQGSRTRAI